MNQLSPGPNHSSNHTQAPNLPRAQLAPGDATRIAIEGIRARPLRAALAGLGIALGVTALVAVVGLSESSKAQINQELDALGTNLLTATAGNSFGGEQAQLPQDAVAMVERIGPVQQAAGVGNINASIYRNDKVDPIKSGGIGVNAATRSLKDTVGLVITDGQWLSAATEQFPTTVLGSTAADRLGITPELIRSTNPTQVWLGNHWFTVIGLLKPSDLTPELDSSALVGWTAAEKYLSFDGHPTTIYETSSDTSVDAVRNVLAATVSPSAPDEVQVSRPSDALAAKAATDAAFTGLLLGLGAIALLVGGLGVANTMVVSVLERRQEIGLRRALGATRRHIRNQFLGEAVTLSVLGGIAGAVLGILVTAIIATFNDWPISLPIWAIGAGLGVTVLVGIVAGIFPASRGAKLPPTAALSI